MTLGTEFVVFQMSLATGGLSMPRPNVGKSKKDLPSSPLKNQRSVTCPSHVVEKSAKVLVGKKCNCYLPLIAYLRFKLNELYESLRDRC